MAKKKGSKKGLKKKGKRKTGSKKGSKKKKQPKSEGITQWIPGPDDEHSLRCRCVDCVLGREHILLELRLLSDPHGEGVAEARRISSVGSKVEKLRQPTMAEILAATAKDDAEDGPEQLPRTFEQHPGDWKVPIHLTPYYTVGDLQVAVAKRLTCIAAHVSFFMNEADAEIAAEPLKLSTVLADVFDGGPPDAPTAATMWIRTADRRFGYSTQSHSYLDFGKAYLGGGQPAKMNKQTEENSTDWVDSNLFFNQDGSSSGDRGVGAVHKSSS